MTQSLLHENLIFLDVSVTTTEDVLTWMAHQLCELGYVKDSYAQALIDREREFATGLPGAGAGIAIPHAEPEHVLKSAIAVGVLKSPVEFMMMGNHDELIDAKIIFMLALHDGHAHVAVLSQLMDVIQNEELLHRIIQTDTQSELFKILTQYIH
jgi:PTS system galactitol-specific IIA component